MESSKEDLSEKFREFVKPVGDLPEQTHWHNDPSVHHATCPPGQCAKNQWARLAAQFVWSMSKHFQDGALDISFSAAFHIHTHTHCHTLEYPRGLEATGDSYCYSYCRL